MVERAVEVLPLVPVRWMAGNSSSGEPRSVSRGRTRSTASQPLALGRDADALLQVDVGVEPRQRLARRREGHAGGARRTGCPRPPGSRGRTGGRLGRVRLGKLHLDRSGVGRPAVGDDGLDVRDAARFTDVVDRGVERGEPLGGVVDDDPRDVGPHRTLGLALRLADRAEHVGGDPVHLDRWASGPAATRQRLRLGPRAAVDRALAVPGPHFLGHERQVRREQSAAACRA